MTQQRDSESQSDARWLRESRRVAGFSNVHKLLAAMAEAGLKPPSYGSYAQWESGKVQPRDESLVSLRAFYAERIKAPVIAPAADPLAAALSALAGELKASREERESLAGRLVAVEAELRSLRDRRAAEAQSGRSAPRRKVG